MHKSILVGLSLLFSTSPILAAGGSRTAEIVGEGGKAGLGGRQGPDSTIWGPDGQPGAAEPIFPKDAQ